MFICGSASFSHENDDDRVLSSYPVPKRATRKSLSFCRLGKSYTNKNPYANRGLDKFYALLSELEEKRQMIYTRMGSEAIAFVQFVYSNDSDNIKPIVIKVKERKEEAANSNATLAKKPVFTATKNPVIRRCRSAIGSEKVHQDQKSREFDEKAMQNKKSCLTCSESFKVENLRQPRCSFPLMVVLALLCLAIFGRTFAILCSWIGWYLIPRVTGDGSNSSPDVKKPKRKELDRRFMSDITKINSTSPNHSGQ
ncbi:hypothetical protein F511_06298 [Dorcoceras hygrometricum]|uniref:ZCF37 n=1 Tax=Dorcoceras hygrometricum TaxID=472368 RepID=A0A2Z7ADC9_9LAMI|nr:hypothetical protein F511_06298 [Dorcoceras hygrometricum]